VAAVPVLEVVTPVAAVTEVVAAEVVAAEVVAAEVVATEVVAPEVVAPAAVAQDAVELVAAFKAAPPAVIEATPVIETVAEAVVEPVVEPVVQQPLTAAVVEAVADASEAPQASLPESTQTWTSAPAPSPPAMRGPDQV